MSPDYEDLEGMESYQQEDYAEAMYEKADNDRKRMKEDGTYWLWQKSGLPYGEWLRQQAEDEAKAAGVEDAY